MFHTLVFTKDQCADLKNLKWKWSDFVKTFETLLYMGRVYLRCCCCWWWRAERDDLNNPPSTKTLCLTLTPAKYSTTYRWNSRGREIGIFEIFSGSFWVDVKTWLENFLTVFRFVCKVSTWKGQVYVHILSGIQVLVLVEIYIGIGKDIGINVCFVDITRVPCLGSNKEE